MPQQAQPFQIQWVGRASSHTHHYPAATASVDTVDESTFVYDEKNDFPYPVGFEFTFLPPHTSNTPKQHLGELSGHYTHVVQLKLKEMQIPFKNVHQDGYCVEINSPVFHQWKELKAYYGKLRKVVNGLGMLPTGHKVASGGNHLHMGPMPHALVRTMMLDLAFRPYLGWVFNDPDDVDSARVFKKGFVQKLIDGLSWQQYGDKHHQFNYRTSLRTLEWRVFRSPWDWAELEAQTKFAYAYLKWIKQANPDSIENAAKARVEGYDPLKLDYENSKDRFHKFVVALGLQWPLYEDLCRKNMFVRYKFGALV